MFVVFPFPATRRCSFLVGKIAGGVRAKEGDEFKVLWYTQEESDASPSIYVLKGWLVSSTRIRVPERGGESVEFAWATFPCL